MSTDAVNAVWSDPQYPAGAQLVMVAIAWRSVNSRGGTADVSQQRLATMTGLSRRRVRAYMDELEAAGALVVEWWKPGHRTRYRVNVGDLHLPVSVVDLEVTPAYQPPLPIVDNPASGVPTVIHNVAGPAPTPGRTPATVKGKEKIEPGARDALWIPRR